MDTIVRMALPVLMQSIVILGLVFLAVPLFRKRSASVRHAVWTSAIVGLLLLPVLNLTTPGINLTVSSPQSAATSNAESVSGDTVSERLALSSDLEAPATIPLLPTTDDVKREALAEVPAMGPVEAARPSTIERLQSQVSESWIGQMAAQRLQTFRGAVETMTWPGVLLFIWLLGFAIQLSRVLAGMLWANRRVRLTFEVENREWLQTSKNLARALGIQRDVQVRLSASIRTPVTWGCFRPFVLLPLSARDWDEKKLRSVLLHELAHVKRFDCLTQVVSSVAAAFFWPNVLVWFALKRQRAAHEEACDNVVLTSGIKASDYASHLLETARSMMTPSWHISPMMAMASTSKLETRMNSILSDSSRRRPIRKSVLAIVAAGMFLTTFAGASLRPTLALESSFDEPSGSTVTLWVWPTAAEAPAEDMEVASMPAETESPLPAPDEDQEESAEICEDYTWEIDVDRDVEVHVSNLSGQIQFVGQSDDEVIIAVELCAKTQRAFDRVTFEKDFSDDYVSIKTEYQDQGRGSNGKVGTADFVIYMPRDGSLVDVSSVSGDISVKGIRGDLAVSAVSGRIEIDDARGAILASVVSGPIDATYVGDDNPNIQMSSVSGKVTLEVRDKINANLNMSSMSGRVSSDLDLNVRDKKFMGGQSISARLGNGRGRIQMSTVSGRVHLEHDGASPDIGQNARQDSQDEFQTAVDLAGIAELNLDNSFDELDLAIADKVEKATRFAEVAAKRGVEAAELGVRAMEQGLARIDNDERRRDLEQIAVMEMAVEEARERREEIKERLVEAAKRGDEFSQRELASAERQIEATKRKESALRRTIAELQREREATGRREIENLVRERLAQSKELASVEGSEERLEQLIESYERRSSELLQEIEELMDEESIENVENTLDPELLRDLVEQQEDRLDALMELLDRATEGDN